MGTVATGVFAALVLVPSLAAAGGNAFWDGETFALPPLRAGERFVYDAILERDGVVLRQHEFLTVLVGDVRHVTLADRTDADVVAVTTSQAPPAWDREAGHPLRAERRVEWFRVSDGAVVHAETFLDERTWDGERGHQRTDFVARFDGGEGGLGRALAAFGKGEYRLGGLGDAGATIGGERVVRVSLPAEARSAATCTAPAPPVEFRMPFPGPAMATSVAWLSPRRALPVASSCAIVGEDAARVTFHLHLVDHEPGHEALPFPVADAYAPQTLVRPRATIVPGLPADGEGRAELELPLADAVDAIRREWGEPTPSMTRDATGAPFRVLEADYRPGPWSCGEPAAGIDLRQACFALGDAGRTRSPRWVFLVVDQQGEQRRVGVVRTIANGVALQDRVWSQDDATATGLDTARLPREMSPLVPVLDDWLPRWGLTYQQWASARDAAIRIEFRTDEMTADDRYAGRITISGEGHDAYVPKKASERSCDAVLTLLSSPCAGRDGPGPEPRVLRHEWAHTYRGGDGVYLARAFTNQSIADKAPPAPRTSDDGLPVRSVSPAPAWAAAGGVAAASLAGVAYAVPRMPRWFRGLLGLALYAHVAREKALDHPTRRDLMGIIQTDPGVTTKELSRRLGIGWGTAVYHLGVLEQHGFAVSHRGGRYRGWFPQGSDAAARQRAATLRSMAAQRVMRFVREKPGCTQREMARAFGVDHVAVIFHTRRLEDSGLLRKERRGRTVHYFATDVALAFVPSSTP